MTLPARAAILGAGEIGRGWAALFAAYGANVALADPDPAVLDRARRSLALARALLEPAAAPGTIRLAPSAAAAVAGAQWVQESVPDDLALRRGVLAEIAGHTAPGAIVASSSGRHTPAEIFAGFPFAARALIAHPLHPVYAVPAIELCAAPRTGADVLAAAAAVLRALGREPILLRGAPAGLVANRLTAALLREAAALVASGVIAEPDLDRLVAHGVATGWCVAGPFATEATGRGTEPEREAQWAERITRVLRAARE